MEVPAITGNGTYAFVDTQHKKHTFSPGARESGVLGHLGGRGPRE